MCSGENGIVEYLDFLRYNEVLGESDLFDHRLFSLVGKDTLETFARLLWLVVGEDGSRTEDKEFKLTFWRRVVY